MNIKSLIVFALLFSVLTPSFAHACESSSEESDKAFFSGDPQVVARANMSNIICSIKDVEGPAELSLNRVDATCDDSPVTGILTFKDGSIVQFNQLDEDRDGNFQLWAILSNIKGELSEEHGFIVCKPAK